MRARWKPVVGASKPAAKKSDPPPGPKKPLAQSLDPYFRWAVATDWRGFAQLPGWNRTDPSKRQWQVLVEAKTEAELKRLLKKAPWATSVHGCYRNPIPGTDATATHFTAQLSFDQLDTLARNRSAPRWRLAMPLRDARSAAEASPKGYYGIDRDLASMIAPNVVADAVKAAKAVQGRKGRTGPGARDDPGELDGAIAVIDFGCPFVNGRFAAASGTRVQALWDQGAEPDAPKQRLDDKEDPALGWPWQKPERFGYGREMGPRTLDAIAQASRAPGAPEETAIYRGIDHLIAYADPRRRVWMATHGGHVLDVAGGAPFPRPLNGQGDGAVEPAACAPLVFVQLPTLTAADSAGVSLGAHLLDGVRYAMARVRKDQPLVVVISYGNTAGPHDGSTQIEQALDQLLQERGGNFAIVLAAGNARDDHCHVHRTVRKDRSALLRVAVAPHDTTDTFVEVWYPGDGLPLEMRVRSPDRVWSDWVSQRGEVLMRATTSDADVVAMIRHDPPHAKGGKALAILALAPTARPPGVSGSLADAGLWEIELRLEANEAADEACVELDGWIERDDPVREMPGGRTRFLDQEEADEQNTLSGIATGGHTIKAGGFNRGTDKPTAYSSLPEAGKPDTLTVLVACEEDTLSPSIAAAATRTSEIYRMNGTSVAAPMLARRLYNRMCVGPPVSRQAWSRVLQDLCGSEPATVKPFSVD